MPRLIVLRLVVLRLTAALLLIASYALAQDSPPGPNKRWNDPAEYDFARAALAQTDPAQQLAALDKWAATYPATEFLDDRQNMYLNTSVVLKQAREAFDTAQEILKTRTDK